MKKTKTYIQLENYLKALETIMDTDMQSTIKREKKLQKRIKALENSLSILETGADAIITNLRTRVQNLENTQFENADQTHDRLNALEVDRDALTSHLGVLAGKIVTIKNAPPTKRRKK